MLNGTQLFALGFGMPALLWGLAAASLPIIIHLLSRRKYRELEWAAMKWLLAALKKNARRIRLEQFLLLAVRTLLVMCVVLAMAKPFLQGAGVPLLPGQRTHRILVLDGSFSMAHRLTDRDRFDRAKDVAQAILQDARKGDVASVVLMASPPRLIVGDPSANLAAVADEVRALELVHGGADLTATLAKIQEVIAASDVEQKEVYFLTDLQRTSWGASSGAISPNDANRHGAPQADQTMQELISNFASEANSVIIDLGQGSNDNLAVVSFELEEPFVTVGRESRFAATFRNFGRTNRSDVGVTLSVDGAVQDRRSIDLAAGEQASIVLGFDFPTAAWHTVEVRLEEDSLPLDNSRYLAVHAKEYVNALLVDGEPSGDRFASETDYLRVALAPESSTGQERSAVRPEIIRESQFLETDLNQFDCVVFANIGQFTDNEARAIEDYLRAGGGVIWFLGDQVESGSYNRVLHRDGQGVFPLQLGSRVGDASKRENFVLFDPRDYAHSIVQPFRGAAQGGLLTTKVFEFIRVELPSESTARVALSFESGEPAVVTSNVHRGRVAVVATSADVEWTNWPFWPSYVPVMHELITYVIADRNRDHNVGVGQTFSTPVPAAALEVPVTVNLPSMKQVPRRIAPRDEISYFAFDETQTSGTYRVHFGPPIAKDELFAVNVDPRESDLTKLEEDELRQLHPNWDFLYLTNWQAIATGKSSVTRNRGELHRYLLLAALGLVFTESLLAWKFGHYSS